MPSRTLQHRTFDQQLAGHPHQGIDAAQRNAHLLAGRRLPGEGGGHGARLRRHGRLRQRRERRPRGPHRRAHAAQAGDQRLDPLGRGRILGPPHQVLQHVDRFVEQRHPGHRDLTLPLGFGVEHVFQRMAQPADLGEAHHVGGPFERMDAAPGLGERRRGLHRLAQGRVDRVEMLPGLLQKTGDDVLGNTLDGRPSGEQGRPGRRPLFPGNDRDRRHLRCGRQLRQSTFDRADRHLQSAVHLLVERTGAVGHRFEEQLALFGSPRHGLQVEHGRGAADAVEQPIAVPAGRGVDLGMVARQQVVQLGQVRPGFGHESLQDLGGESVHPPRLRRPFPAA